MKSLKNLLLESLSEELINTFIEYLNKHGKNGTINGNANMESVEKLIDNCNPEESDTYSLLKGKWDRKFKRLTGKSAKDNATEYMDFLKGSAKDEIIWDLSFKNGLIYVERSLSIPIDNVSNMIKELDRKYKGHLGTYWTFIEDNAQAYLGNNAMDVVLKGYVSEDSVDWSETVVANLADPDELELKLRMDVPILLVSVECNDNEYHLNKTIYRS